LPLQGLIVSSITNVRRLLSGLIRFTMRLRLDQQDLDSIKEIETNCSKHISVVNDIYSWDKELKASKVGHKEGAVLCSAVSVLSAEMALSIPSTKRVLWVMCREWELQHKQLVVNRLTSGQSCSYDLQMFMKGLEFQMSGNEVWSSTTSRYHPVQM
jgi:aristolochene synthase